MRALLLATAAIFSVLIGATVKNAANVCFTSYHQVFRQKWPRLTSNLSPIPPHSTFSALRVQKQSLPKYLILQQARGEM